MNNYLQSNLIADIVLKRFFFRVIHIKKNLFFCLITNIFCLYIIMYKLECIIFLNFIINNT